MSRLTEQDLGEIYTFAVGLGRRAGQILQQGVERRTAGCEGPLYAEKDNAVDIVTQTDQGTSSHVYQDGAFNEIARQAEGVSSTQGASTRRLRRWTQLILGQELTRTIRCRDIHRPGHPQPVSES